MKKQEIVKRTDEILDRITEMNKEIESLTEEFKQLFPIKSGEKVSVIDSTTNNHKRFAIFEQVSIYNNGEGTARIKISLIKCKQDGTASRHNDYLGFREAICKIK